MLHNALAESIRIGRDFGRLKHPESGKSPMSNWSTQLLGNRPVTATAVWKLGSESEEIRLVSFQPARDLESGAAVRSAVKKFRIAYETGKIPDDTVRGEVLRVASYLAASVATGQLPTPTRISAESTLKGAILSQWLESMPLALESLEVHKEDGIKLEYPASAVEGILMVFAANYQRIVDTYKLETAKGENLDLDWSKL